MDRDVPCFFPFVKFLVFLLLLGVVGSVLGSVRRRGMPVEIYDSACSPSVGMGGAILGLAARGGWDGILDVSG